TSQGRNGYQSGLETGDLVFGSYCAFMYCVGLYFMGRELAMVEREMATYAEAVGQLNQQITVNFLNIFRQSILNLINPTEDRGNLTGEVYNEEEMLPFMLEMNDRTSLFYVYFNKMVPYYLFQDYRQALENAPLAEQYSGGVIGSLYIPAFNLYDSLIRLALVPEAEKSEQEQLLEKVAANQEKMKVWAGHGPMNYLHKYYLVEAERARVLGQDNEARDYYDKAIDLAQENEYLNEEALAHELAGKFYLARGQTRLARHYLRDAHYAYLRWGASAKVKDLETRYPQFLVQAEARSRELPISTTPTTDSSETASSTLDLASVLKASHAISGEIVLDQLLEKLMKIVIENAGAQHGYLILEEDGRWVIEAEAKAEAEIGAEVKALQSMPVEQSEKLPSAVINYVTRTKEHIVLNDAGHEGMFTKDPYISHNQPKSILCAPLINQGKLNGLLYLENNLTTSAFTPDRLEVLNILSAQAAISIENARLYTRQVELTDSASRFVPQEFLKFLHKDSIAKVNLGDQIQQNMTILVSDIRSFTTLSETMTPQENFDFVNAYLGRVSPIIRQHNGLIAKYMGDGMMAVFPRRVEDALNAAISQLKEVARYNADRQQRAEAPLQIGIGIHTGPVMLGTVGETQRMQLDLFSDAVNVAARLEGLSKLYGVPLILSTEALQRLAEPDQYQVRFLGKTHVKGRQEMLSVFEVFDGDLEEIIALKVESKADFEKGLSLYYDWQFVEAKAHFEQVLQCYPADKASQFYLKRMADFTEPR
ncbi:MAG TPA: adenylate/guanylate cyclase domain-containing protein, partial [Anaerolineae bacterium]|nr:adenylate/guanylate cyclase domain-containing protein [Anaerolineae bacterium]